MAEVATAEKPVTDGIQDGSEQPDRSLRFEAELEVSIDVRTSPQT